MTTEPAPSPTIDPTTNLAAALAVLQTRLPRISKDKTAKVQTKTGPGYQYRYSDLAQISSEVLPLMGAVGLSFTARPTVMDGRFVLAYELLHVSGESREGVYPIPERGTPQEVGGAITYARRYCLCAITGVAPDDDDDAAAAQKAAEKRERRADRQQPTASNEEPRITGDQQRKMQALFGKRNITDRAAKLQYAIDVVGRPLTSSTELTRSEAGRVIDRLDQPDPPATDDDAEAWLASQQPPLDGVR